MWIIVAGNPIDGFEMFGPFDTDDEAIDWADRYVEDTEWWATQVLPPPRPSA